MPVENERKYVLTLEPERILSEVFWSPESDRLPDIFVFDQFYLDNRCRIRRRENIQGLNINNDTFTYKKKVNGQTIEIETSISAVDFDKLRQVAEKGLSKVRVVFDAGAYTWEVDFFVPTDTEGVPIKERILYSYLIMAEVELDENEVAPDHIPACILDNLVYSVPEEDSRFKSSRLTEPQETRKLYDSLWERQNNAC
jgi:CYTH domain-containing protein